MALVTVAVAVAAVAQVAQVEMVDVVVVLLLEFMFVITVLMPLYKIVGCKLELKVWVALVVLEGLEDKELMAVWAVQLVLPK